MVKRWKLPVVLLIALLVSTITSAAPEKATQPIPTATVTATDVAAVPATDSSKSGFERFRDWFHNPAPWLEMGADLRMRWTYGWNLTTLNDHPTNRDTAWNWYQNRMRLGMKFKLNEDIDFNLRYTWEFRVWDSPRRKNGDGSAAETRTHRTDFSEIVWDQFNLTMRNFGGMPLTVVAGRQDIKLGEGWLVADGTPLDAARTAYFDALRFTYQMPNREKTTLDLIYIENRGAENAYLKPINDRHRFATEQDERAVIAYYTDKSRPSMNIEGYFIFKNDNPVDAIHNTRGATGYDRWPSYWSKKAQIYTLGGALSGSIGQSEHWKYRTEGAVQTGKKQTQEEGSTMHDLLAFGTTNKIEYHFNDAKKNKLRGSFEFLSGDDPDNSKNTAFDPLWGEWPRNSETLLYTYNLETMIGEVTNLYRLGFGHSIQLTEKMSMDTDVHMLWADENTEKNRSHAGVIEFSDSGKYRGTLGTWLLKYAVTKNLNANLLLEYFEPGDYYRSGNRDAAYFARINLDYTF